MGPGGLSYYSSSQRRTGGLLLMVAALTLFVVSALASDGEKRMSLKKNINIAHQWMCKKPQPRLVYIGELDGYIAPNTMYIPPAVLVHRCDDSTGCCLTPGQKCASVEHQEEQINFVIQAIVSAHTHAIKNHKKKEKKLVVQLSNHTHCECVGRNNLRARRTPTQLVF